MNSMDKDLKTIQKLAKVGKVLSRIYWIFCIVGIVGSLVGIASLIMGVDQLLKIGGVTIHGIINNESGMTLGSMYAAMGVAIITCIRGMIFRRRKVQESMDLMCRVIRTGLMHPTYLAFL